MIDLDSVVCAREDAVSSGFDEDVLILNMTDGEYYELNGSAGRIWEALKKPTTVGEILAKIKTEYRVDHETAKRDLIEALETFIGKGLIEIHDSPASPTN